MKFRAFLIFSFLLFMSASTICMSLEEEDDNERDPCQGTSAMEFGQCAEDELKESDEELNRVYRELMAALPDVGNSSTLTKKKLRAEEKKWIRWKFKQCDKEGEEDGGAQTWKSAYTVKCWARVTEERLLKLKEMQNKLSISSASPAK